MKGYEARLFEDGTHWDRNVVQLAIRDPNGGYLMPDGTWQRFEEGTVAVNHGLDIPRGAIEAIATAIAEFQGHTSHADTEARVLREVLDIERKRVDRLLGGSA